MDEYKEKLRAFCEALQYPNVEEMIEKSPSEFKEMGEAVVRVISYVNDAVDKMTAEILSLKNKKD